MSEQRTVDEFLRENIRPISMTGSILSTVIRLIEESRDPALIPILLQLTITQDTLRFLLESSGVTQEDVDQVIDQAKREADMIETLRNM